jgi:hypothetical protein
LRSQGVTNVYRDGTAHFKGVKLTPNQARTIPYSNQSHSSTEWLNLIGLNPIQ